MSDDAYLPAPSDGYTEDEKTNPDARPTPIPVNPDGVDRKLRSYPQWVCWRFQWSDDRDEWSKIPINPRTGRNAKSNRPSETSSFQEAVEYHEREDTDTDTDGFGFIVTDSPFAGIDLDGVYDPETGEFSEDARGILDRLGTYSEYSPSGRGGRAFAIGDLPDGGRKNDPVEMYDTGRYLTVTGQRIPDTPESVVGREDGEAALSDVHRDHFPDDYDDEQNTLDDVDADGADAPATTSDAPDVPTSPADGADSEDAITGLSDATVINLATNAKNGDYFADLWAGDWEPHTDRWNGDSQSEADGALCCLLAFWTGPNREQIDRLFRRSGLMRPKWDESHSSDGSTYGELTIDGALGNVTEYYDADRDRAEAAGTAIETPVDWDDVRDAYAQSRSDGRLAAANYLDATHSWMFVLETETLWVYEPSRGRFAPWGETTAANILERNLQRSYSRTDRAEIIDRLKARSQTHRDALNGGNHPEPLLCVGNGVVDLSTGELRDHDPAYLFTRGVEWDYGADHADREPILQFLDDITERTEDRDTLLDHLAHGLMPGHPYRAFVMMYGPGSNGKTQFGQIIRGFVGTENAASVDLPEITQGDFATGALPGKFVNFGDENSVSEIRDATDLKSLTGGGTMRANEKNEKQFDFENEAAMFFAANEPPRITEEKDAIADRLYPISMPYQFKGETEYDPDNPIHRPKVTGIAEDLLSNGAAMCGLLDLCVEHAQRLIETDGQYSMPEGPAERRLMYEAASDPLARFVLKCLESGEPTDVVLKDDAYAVYKTLCEIDNERVMKEDTFKTKLTQQAAVDVENTRVRWLTPGDSRDRGWRHIRFGEDATDYMNERLRWRYFPDGERVEPGVGAGDGGDLEDPEADTEDPEAERDVFGALPIARAASTLTGYITVTVQLANVDGIGDTNGVRAIVKDTSGAIDVVAWDQPYTTRLKELAGEYVVIENAEVTEYEGKRQLSPIDGLTEIDTIQAGVGHTAGPNVPDGQADLNATAAGDAEADGGTTVPDDAEGAAADARRLRTLFEPDAGEESIAMDHAEVVQAAIDDLGMSEDDALDALAKMLSTGMLYKADDGLRLA